MFQQQQIPSDDDNKKAAFWSCNKAIERNFVSLGANLKRIRDEDLWLYANSPDSSKWSSFEDFCQKEHDLSKGYVSRLISAANLAITMQVRTNIDIPTEPVATELRKVSDEDRVRVLEGAAAIASQYGRKITSVDVKMARLQVMGGLPEVVQEAAARLNWEQDPDRLDTLLHWYQEGKDNQDSKFWTAYQSGVLDPADGKPPITLATASMREIRALEQRWQKTVIDIIKDDPAIRTWTGMANQDILLDGQMVRIANLRVRITVL